MGYFLSVSDEAARNVRSIAVYLRSEWTERSVIKFENDLINAFENILANPHSFL